MIQLPQSVRASALTLVFLAHSLNAGVLLIETREPLKLHEHASTTTIQIEGSRISIDTRGKDGHQAFIFHADRGIMWLVDYDRKIYREVSTESVENLRDERSQALAVMESRVEQQLENLPPEQRQAMEEAMKARLNTAGTGDGSSQLRAKREYKKTTAGAKVNQWTCDWYEGREKGQKTWEICSADWANLGFKPDDFAIIEQVDDFFRRLRPRQDAELLKVGLKDGRQTESYSGVPVTRISYQQGQMSAVYEVKEIRRQDFPESVFEVPAGFQHRSLILLDGAGK